MVEKVAQKVYKNSFSQEKLIYIEKLRKNNQNKLVQTSEKSKHSQRQGN